MAADTPEPLDEFETWLLHCVAKAVEAGEVSADLLTELQAEFYAARERSQEEGHAAAIQHIADLAGAPEAEARSVLEAIQAQPSLTRELLMRRFAEAWLERQRREYQSGRDPSGRA